MLQLLFRVLLISVCAVFALAGCGGGGGGGGTTPKTATPSVSVDWPERSRTVTAPSSAQSVRFTLHHLEDDHADVTFVGNRGANLAPHTATFTSPTAAHVGDHTLTVTFFADPDGEGAVVGAASANVRLQESGSLTKPDGTPLGTIGFTGTVAGVSLLPDQTVQVGQELEFAAAVTDAEGDPIVVSPGSFVFTVTGGADKLSITKDGVATGLQGGTATVTVTVDGITSAPVTITVVEIATPILSVAWPERSRAVAAPSSALSVRFTLNPVEGGQPNITFVGNRGENLAPHTANYPAPASGQVGDFSLQATFYAAPDAAGIVVGTAGADVRLQANGGLTKPDGTPLGTLDFTAVAASVRVFPGQTLRQGEELPLAASVADAEGDPVVVSPGSFLFTVAAGGENLSVTKDGIAKGLQPGTAMVTVSIDGITSAPATVGVIANEPSLMVLDIRATDFAYDASRDVLYAATQGGVIPINPSTGQAGAPVTTPLSQITVSEDGRYLFGSAGNSIRRLNLATGQVDLTIADGELWTVRDIIPMPGRPETIVVVRRDTLLAVETTLVYDGDVRRPNSAEVGRSVALRADGARAYGHSENDGNGTYYFRVAEIDASGVKVVETRTNLIRGFLNRIVVSGDRVVSNDGVVVAADGSVNDLGDFGITTGFVMSYPSVDRVRFLTGDRNRAHIRTVDIAAFTQVGDFAMPTLAGDPEAPAYAGPGRVAFGIDRPAGRQIGLVQNLP